MRALIPALVQKIPRRLARLAAIAAMLAGCRDAHEVEITAGPPRLVGYLYRPAGDGPFPAILYNHGSEADPDRPPRLATFFNDRGYVFFAPFRRGRPPSGGVHEKALVARAPEASRKAVFVQELEAQLDDILAGLEWLKRQPYVDPHRVVVAGHSLGGVESLFLAARRTDLRAALSIGAGIPGWDVNEVLRQRMIAAAAAATIPVIILQAENDYAKPAPALGEAMTKAGRRGFVKVYPAVGKTPKEGHGGFSLNPGIWGDDAIRALDEALR